MSELPVGRIVGVFGVRGELKCDPTDAGRTLFIAGACLRFEVGGALREARIARVREHKGRLLLHLDGVANATDAQALSGAIFYAPRDQLRLNADEFFDVDLIGCEVVDSAGVRIGRVSAVEHYPASDMLMVNDKMIPMVRAFIRAIDTVAKRIEVDLPEGLLD